ncbi:MAG: hypothetical protein ABIJ56_01530 [Pseudomonadota bacterium]
MNSLTSFLVHKGCVSPKVLQEALLGQTLKGGSAAINLLEMKALTETILVKMTGQFYRLLVVSLEDLVSIPVDIIRLVSRDVAEDVEVVPFDLEGENVYFACCQPPARHDENMIRNITGKIPRFFIASPLAVSLALWIHYRVEISQRVAKIIERINRDENPFLDRLVETIEESKRAHLYAVIEKRWEAFPIREDKRDTLVEFEGKEVEKERVWEEPREEEEISSEISTESDVDGEVFSKYIVINRIGARPRRPSRIFMEPGESMRKQEKDLEAERKEAAPVKVLVPRDGRVATVIPEKEARQEARGFPIPMMGILTMSEVLGKIEKASSANEVIDAIHDFATQFFGFVMMFRYRKGRFELSMASARGWGYAVDEMSARHMVSSSLPESIVKFARPCIFPVPDGHVFEKVLTGCGRTDVAGLTLIPISVKERVIVLICGEREGGDTKFDEISDLFHAAWMASNKLLGFIIDRKK